MRKIVSLLFFAGLFICFHSCTKDADVKLPQVEAKLVIISFISPQDTIVKVAITRSQPLFNNSSSNQYSNITDATVQISNGTASQTLSYNSVDNYYYISTVQFPIVAGVTYYLTASTPDGKNINSSTTIPSSNTSLTYTAEASSDPNNPGEYYIDAEWTDAPGAGDYYRVMYYYKYYYTGDIDTSFYMGYHDTISDRNNDGGNLIKSFETYSASDTTGSDEGELYLIHASYEYYLYHRKLEEAAFSGGPFAEAVQMYSNINGGYGVFAGYNSYKVLVFL